MENIRQNYGYDLEGIEENINKIIDNYFLDGDGFILNCINKRTLKPFVKDDPEINEIPIHEGFWANASLSFELKKTAVNYEDSDMAAGDYLLALLAKSIQTPELVNKVRGFFQIMVKFYDAVVQKNPYGAGFLPKPYGGISRVGESCETSADQYFKFTLAMEKYASWTNCDVEKAKAEEIILSFATWLDEHDFVTPYSGSPQYGRLHTHMQYLGYFAYIMMLGYKIGANSHFKDEALFFKDKMLECKKLSGSPNSKNLVVEIADRLIELIPEFKQEWLEIIEREWDNRSAYVDDDGNGHFSDCIWNYGTRLATTYNTVIKHFPDKTIDLDLERLLLNHNNMEKFVLLTSFGTPSIKSYQQHKYCAISQAYVCWLRAFWENKNYLLSKGT